MKKQDKLNFLIKNSLDEKKTNVLIAIVGMEYFQYELGGMKNNLKVCK